MKQMKRTILIVGLALIWGQMSFAEINGIKEGGGGVGFLCHENGTDKVYLADTYDLVKGGALKGKESLDTGIIFLAAGQRFTEANIPDDNFKNFLSAGWSLIVRSSFLKWEVEHNLPLLGDDHITQVPQNCEKVQIAIQDLSHGVVHWDDDLVSKMTHAESGFFVLHETLIALRNDPGADTSPIRAAVASVLDSQGFAKFVQNIIDPNTILPIQTGLEPYEKLVSELPGKYSGKDPLKKDCSVTISRDGDHLSFAEEYLTVDGATETLNVPSIPVAGLVQKLAYDTSEAKQRPDYSSSWLTVNYYSYQGLPSLFGAYPLTNSAEVNWYKGPLESINLENDYSKGPFRDLSRSNSHRCYSLSRSK